MPLPMRSVMSNCQSIPNYRHPVFFSQHNTVSDAYQTIDMQTLSERLKEVRNEKGLTQEELRVKAGLKRQSIIGGLESSDQKTSSYLPQIAEALGVRALWLATGKGPKYVTDQTPLQEPTQFLNAKTLYQCFQGVNAYIADGSRPVTEEQRVELACYLYEMFHDQESVTKEKMALWLERMLSYAQASTRKK